MKNAKEVTYIKLKNSFLSGQYICDTDECVDAINALHGSLTSMDELIPLLISENRSCQEASTYIAALEGERACSIFPYVFDLINSPWVEVRDEVCDCFTSCANKAEQFVKLFELFNDSEQSIRLKVIQVLCCLEYERIALIHQYTKSIPDFSNLNSGLSLLLDQMRGGLSFDDIKNSILAGIRIIKIFSYVAACHQFGNTSELLSLAELTDEADILKHHEIYFMTDYVVEN